MPSKLRELLGKLSIRSIRTGLTRGHALDETNEPYEAPLLDESKVIPLHASPAPTDPNSVDAARSGSRFLLGGLGDSEQMYALDDDWRVQSHRKVDPASVQGVVIAADPAQDMARRIDYTVSERVQLAEFGSDIGEVLLAVKTRARSGLAQIFRKKASSVADHEEGETLGAAQAIQERGWWLCTPVQRLKSLAPSVRVLPLASVLLKMLEARSRSHGHGMDSGPTVVVLVFPGQEIAGQDDGFHIVCLATFTAAGHLEGLDFVPGSGMSVQQVLSNYVSVRRLSADGLWPQERLVVASTADPQVKKWLSGAPAYPRQKLVLGMPVQQAARLSMAASAAALALAMSYSAYGHWRLSQMRSDITKAQAAQLQARTQAVAAVRERSLGYVLSHAGLNTHRAIDLAAQAWQPGTLVEMQASTERVTLTLSAPLGQGERQGESTSTAASLVNAPPPQGCTAAPTQVNASLNQLVITYECTLQNPELERIRAAGF